MPNWCSNSVTVSGPREQIMALVETRFDLAQILPEPDYEEVAVAPAFPREGEPDVVPPEEAWWDWRVTHWGTKWNVGGPENEVHAQVESEEGERVTAGFGFDTAWNPPLGCYAELKRQGLLVRAFYYEPGDDFLGVWDDGDDRVYTLSDHDSGSEFWASGDGKELDEQFDVVEDLLEEEE